MKLLVFAAAAMVCSCAHLPTQENRPSQKARRFFEDYVRNDGPAADTLPVFLNACRADSKALKQVFSDYRRFGSGDNEAWGDVPDVLLEELSDQVFSDFLSREDLDVQLKAVKWLGPPGSSLFEDAELKLVFPKTSQIQEKLYTDHPTTRP